MALVVALAGPSERLRANLLKPSAGPNESFSPFRGRSESILLSVSSILNRLRGAALE